MTERKRVDSILNTHLDAFEAWMREQLIPNGPYAPQRMVNFSGWLDQDGLWWYDSSVVESYWCCWCAGYNEASS